jgi:hypothetical protein
MVSIRTHPQPNTPHYRRIRQVFEQLISYVKTATGKGCSRKLISKWKKERSDRLTVIETQSIAPNKSIASIAQHDRELSLASEKSIALIHQRNETDEIAPQTSTASIQKEDKLESIDFATEALGGAIAQIPPSNFPKQPYSLDVPQLDPTHLNKPATKKTSKSSSSRLGRILTIATATTIGLVGCGNWLNNKSDRPSNYQPAAAIAQEIPATSRTAEASEKTSNIASEPASPPVKRTPKLEPRNIKISLTLSRPEDLKVKPGDKIVKGQTLSDRADDRSKLLARKKQLELTLAKLDLPLPPLTPPKSIQPLSKLPPISYQEERANIKLKEQELSKADKAIANQFEKIKQLRALFQTNAEGQKGRDAGEQQKQKSFTSNKYRGDSVSKFSSAPQPLSPSAPPLLGSSTNQSLNSQAQNNTSKLQLILSHEQAVLENLVSQRKEASLQLSIASAKLTTAKEQRAYSEYQRQLEETKRASLQQQQWLEVQRQQEERSRQLQLIEYNKSQIKAQITEIDNQISQLSTVAAPYEGTIEKVKWTGQSDHTLGVELTLIVTNKSENVQLDLNEQIQKRG